MAITSYAQLEKELNKHINIAIENVAKIVCNKLMDCIDKQYYNDPGFYPNVYKRTETFLQSATYEMLGSNSAQIGIDSDSMYYKTGFPGRTVVELASKSMHGSERYQTNTESFWDVFEEWCNDNIFKLLKNELRNQGLNVK